MSNTNKQEPNYKAYYDILGLKNNATLKEIKQAYRKCVLKTHPDKNIQNKEAAKQRFQQIAEAYTILLSKFESTKFSIDDILNKNSTESQNQEEFHHNGEEPHYEEDFRKLYQSFQDKTNFDDNMVILGSQIAKMKVQQKQNFSYKQLKAQILYNYNQMQKDRHKIYISKNEDHQKQYKANNKFKELFKNKSKEKIGMKILPKVEHMANNQKLKYLEKMIN